MLSARDLSLLRFGLIFVWLTTAFASVWELQGQSLQLLTSAGIHDRTLAAFGTMVVMTLAATAVAPALWLHPLGPLTKNAPIAVALWVLARARS
jgi:hypothetical protein